MTNPEITTPATPPPGQGGRDREQAPRQDGPQIREWAREQGLSVARTGRLSKEVVALYDEAHPTPVG